MTGRRRQSPRLIGLGEFFIPMCIKKYADVSAVAAKALSDFASDVRQGRFPAPQHTFQMDSAQVKRMNELTPGDRGRPRRDHLPPGTLDREGVLWGRL